MFKIYKEKTRSLMHIYSPGTYFIQMILMKNVMKQIMIVV